MNFKFLIMSEIGLIGATFTDLRVLSGPDTQKCFYWYGSTRAKVAANKEVLNY